MAYDDYSIQQTPNGSVVVIREKDNSDGCSCGYGTIIIIGLLLYIISLLGGC